MQLQLFHFLLIWVTLAKPELTTFKHSTSLELKKKSSENTHPSCPALTHFETMGTFFELWEIQFGGPGLTLSCVWVPA